MGSSFLDIKKCNVCEQLLAVNEGIQTKDGAWICEDDECKDKHEKQKKGGM